MWIQVFLVQAFVESGIILLQSNKTFMSKTTEFTTLLKSWVVCLRGGKADARTTAKQVDGSSAKTSIEFSDAASTSASAPSTKTASTKNVIQNKLENLDHDGDGRIDVDEYIRAGGTAEEFAKLDADGSGYIEKEEYKIACRDLCPDTMAMVQDVQLQLATTLKVYMMTMSFGNIVPILSMLVPVEVFFKVSTFPYLICALCYFQCSCFSSFLHRLRARSAVLHTISSLITSLSLPSSLRVLLQWLKSGTIML